MRCSPGVALLRPSSARRHLYASCTGAVARGRLARLEAPELDTPEGRRARDFVAACLLPARSIVIQTPRFDRYARYVTHLFYSEQDLSIDDCFARGRYLNDELIESRHARLL